MSEDALPPTGSKGERPGIIPARLSEFLEISSPRLTPDEAQTTLLTTLRLKLTSRFS